nr:hypothetical protein [Methylibium sp.]
MNLRNESASRACVRISRVYQGRLQRSHAVTDNEPTHDISFVRRCSAWHGCGQVGSAPTGDALVQPLGAPLHDRDVDALQQPMQLLHRQRRYRSLLRPDEAILLEALQQQPEAVAVPAQDLHAVAPPVAEDVHARRERVQAERLFYPQRQAVDVEPEVDRLAVQVDLQAFVETEHRTLPSVSMTTLACCTSTSRRSKTTPLGSRACRFLRTAWRLSSVAAAAVSSV